MALYGELNKENNKGSLSDESKGLPWGEVIRDYDPEPSLIWRWGLPNYARVNKAYFRHRSKIHAEGSLESVVNKIVKNWEVESHHVADPKQWKTMDSPNFKIAVNGGATANAQLMAEEGPYNLLMGESPAYSAKLNTFETSNALWSRTFPEGFAWEVTEVLAGPPVVTFQWRHFGVFSGEFVDRNGVVHKGNGELISVMGLCIAKVTEDLKVASLDVYYNPEDLVRPLLKNSTSEGRPIEPDAGEAMRAGSAPACGCGTKGSGDACTVM